MNQQDSKERLKVLIEHHHKSGDPEFLVIRDINLSKEPLKKMVNDYIKNTSGSLIFKGGDKNMKTLIYNNSMNSVYKDDANNCFKIKDPDLVEFIINNHNKDKFELTDDPQKIEENRRAGVKTNPNNLHIKRLSVYDPHHRNKQTGSSNIRY